MPKYEFVIQNDISSRPSAALRSHAVKNGLRRKTLDSEENESRDSEHAKQQQHNLRSRFRVSGTVKRKNRNRHASQHITPLTTPSVHTTNTQICSVKDARGSRKVAEYIVTFTPTSVLIKAPSQTAVDPFGTIYLKRTRDMNNLIKYCKQTALFSTFSLLEYSPLTYEKSSPDLALTYLAPKCKRSAGASP